MDDKSLIMLLVAAIAALFSALVGLAIAFRNQINKNTKTTKELTDKVLDMGIRFAETQGALKSVIESNVKSTDRNTQVMDEMHRTILKSTQQR